MQTLISISFMLALSGIAVGESVLLVRIDQAHSLQAALRAANDGAIEDAREAMAEKLAGPNDATSRSAPAPRETTLALCFSASTDCHVHIHETFTRTDISLQNPTVADSASPCLAQPVKNVVEACNLEAGNGVIEGRSDVSIRVSLVLQPDRELASMQSRVRLRTLNVPPYALIVGISHYITNSPLAGTGDIGGIPSNQDSDVGTLIVTVDPCRKIPTDSLVHMKGEKLAWGNWQGTERDTGIEMPCLPGAGATNLFATGLATQPNASTGNWSP